MPLKYFLKTVSFATYIARKIYYNIIINKKLGGKNNVR